MDAAIKPLREQKQLLEAEVAGAQQALKALLDRIETAKKQAAKIPEAGKD